MSQEHGFRFFRVCRAVAYSQAHSRIIRRLEINEVAECLTISADFEEVVGKRQDERMLSGAPQVFFETAPSPVRDQGGECLQIVPRPTTLQHNLRLENCAPSFDNWPDLSCALFFGRPLSLI